MIFVDADAYIALNVQEDANHKKASVLYKKLATYTEQIVTSWDVVDEVTTKLSYYKTHELAKAFLKDILASTIRLEFANSIFASLAEKLFAKQTSKRVSLTDCVNMVIAKSLGIQIFFSFDRHYLKNGFKLLTS